MQNDPTDHLHVVVPQLQGAPGRFTRGSEGLREQIVQGLPLGQALPEEVRLPAQFIMRAGLHGLLKAVDAVHGLPQAAHIAFVGIQEALE